MCAETNVKQSTEVTVNLAERSVTYVSNTVFQLLFRITHRRGLRSAHITEDREIIENGLFTWLSEQTLLRACLEVFLPGDNKVLEQWEFRFNYTSGHGDGTKYPPVAELEEFCARLRSLPQRADYRIVTQTSPGATEVPGWELTEFRPIDRSQSQEFQAWGYGNITATLTFRGG